MNTASPSERRTNKFEGMFLEYCLNQRLEVGEVATRMGMSSPTLKKRRKNVDELSVGDIRKICAITGMPLKEVVGILFGLNLEK